MGIAAWPSCPSGALRASGAWCAVMARPVSASHAVQSSPCTASSWRQRYKVRHACAKPAKLGHFGRAGRVLYRKWGCAWVQLPFFLHQRAPHPVPPGPPAPSALLAVGFCSIRSWLAACCRSVVVLMVRFPPRVAVRSWVGIVGCPKCRPPRRKTLKTGCLGRGGLRFERNSVWQGGCVLAGEPSIPRAHPIDRTLTL